MLKTEDENTTPQVTMATPSADLKRSPTPPPDDTTLPNKRTKTEGTPKDPSSEYVWPSKKKYAVLMGFCGEAYRGMAYQADQPGIKTVEEELIKALSAAKLVRPENAKELRKMYFQRASRTDKGVSAARQIVSCNLNLAEDQVEAGIAAINEALPDDIVVYDFIRATKHFDSHKFASSRVYEYLCPTFAMAPTFGDTWSGYRMPKEVLERARDFFQKFIGTKNFFNYSCGRKFKDPSCMRYLRSITVSDPFISNDLEWVSITLHGDSFIYHQIRKTVGMTIAVLRNITPEGYFERSWTDERLDVPLAPGLGLVLGEVRVDRYNIKFGDNGFHKPIVWEPYEEKVNEFKKRVIYSNIFNKEKRESSMFIWLQTLKNHKFYTGNVIPTILQTPSEKPAEGMSEGVSAEEKGLSEGLDGVEKTGDGEKKDSEIVIDNGAGAVVSS
eukprot:sb/3464744/